MVKRAHKTEIQTFLRVHKCSLFGSHYVFWHHWPALISASILAIEKLIKLTTIVVLIMSGSFLIKEEKLIIYNVSFCFFVMYYNIFTFAVRYTSCRAFLMTLNELNDYAGQHEVIAENLSSQIIAELTRYTQELKAERKSVRTCLFRAFLVRTVLKILLSRDDLKRLSSQKEIKSLSNMNHPFKTYMKLQK